jgi:hypothetical protein
LPFFQGIYVFAFCAGNEVEQHSNKANKESNACLFIIVFSNSFIN